MQSDSDANSDSSAVHSDDLVDVEGYVQLDSDEEQPQGPNQRG